MNKRISKITFLLNRCRPDIINGIAIM